MNETAKNACSIFTSHLQYCNFESFFGYCCCSISIALVQDGVGFANSLKLHSSVFGPPTCHVPTKSEAPPEAFHKSNCKHCPLLISFEATSNITSRASDEILVRTSHLEPCVALCHLQNTEFRACGKLHKSVAITKHSFLPSPLHPTFDQAWMWDEFRARKEAGAPD